MMDSHGVPIEVHVPRRAHNGVATEKSTVHRPLSVSEALQYTPLTTSVLPAHDRIPLPQIMRTRESGRLTSAAERKQVQLALGQIPNKKIRDKLRGFLQRDALAEMYDSQANSKGIMVNRVTRKFKFEPTKSRELTDNQSDSSPNAPYTFSPAAQMVLDMSQIDYRYRSYVPPGKSANSSSTPRPHVQAAKRPSSDAKLARTSTSTHLNTINDTFTVDKTASSQPVIKIPIPPSSFKREDYESSPNASKKEKARQENIAAPAAVQSRSQKATDDIVLQQFQDLMMEIFEAQDQIDAGAMAEPDIFDLQEDGDGSDVRLSMRILERLQQGLKKLLALKRLSELSAEHLRRLQCLCERSIEQAQTTYLSLSADVNADDQSEWRDRARLIEAGMANACVCLYIVSGCPHEDVLISTEARAWIPNMLTNVFDNCLIPVIETRPDTQEGSLFDAALSVRDVLKRLLDGGKRLLDVITATCAEVRSFATSVHPIEFLSAKLIFVQNATTDKTSCLGIQSFEKVRKVAMSCLSKIYARFPRERNVILDEILTSLDKLPSNSRSARQYRLGDGKSIQLISALFMQLVQTAALEMPQNRPKSKHSVVAQRHERQDDSDDEALVSELAEDNQGTLADGPTARLRNKAITLFDSSARGAHEIVVYLVSRASKTSKSGDSPYRNVLDLFIEDLATVLPLPEWPAAELMLRLMAKKMVDLATNDKSALTKNMALESLGTMGSAISTLKASLPAVMASIERDGRVQTEVSRRLCQVARDFESNSVHVMDLFTMDGAFAVSSRQMLSEIGDSLRTRGACGYFLAHFAKLVSRDSSARMLDEDDIEDPQVRVANWLLDVIPQIGSGDAVVHHTDDVGAEEAELAYTLCVLSVGFCPYFPAILKTLASSFSSDQAQVRSRSLKSVVAMLETDSSLLDRDHSIAEDVFRCASDDSALVRDSALSLIAKFIISKPSLEQKGIKRLLECANDSKVGVQKRAIGHLKDIYVKDRRDMLKAKIASTFLLQTANHEEVVAELAKRTITEIWITPALNEMSNSIEAKQTVAVQALAQEIVGCIVHNPAELAPLLQKFLVSLLHPRNPSTDKARSLCAGVVNELFELTISGAEDQGPLHSLTAFAAAESSLIPPERLAKLQSYLGNIQNESDLFIFRSVLQIYRCVLPDISATHKPLLADIQTSLMKVVPALGRRAELDPVMSCLRTIDGVLKNTLKLVKFSASIFNGIQLSAEHPAKLLRFLRMAGPIGRHLDLEPCVTLFAKDAKGWKGGSVADYMAEVFYPFTNTGQSREVRALALEGLGSICQASPILLTRKHITSTLFSVFAERKTSVTEDDHEHMQLVVLRLINELYEERAQNKEGNKHAAETEEQQELGKMGGDSKTRQSNSAVVTITPQIVEFVLRLALSCKDERAWLATQILANISHEGLIHPKQSTSAFVALSTSLDERVAKVAHDAHSLLHQTHESVTEREYIYAIPTAFTYQNSVFHSPMGAHPDSYSSKLAKSFGIVNTSGAKYVKKFLSGMVTKIANEVTMFRKQQVSGKSVNYARFVVQNIAFFEYSRTEELLHVILQLELAYSKTGAEVAQILEKSLNHGPPPPTVPPVDGLTAEDQSAAVSLPAPRPVDSDILKTMAPVAAILSLFIETRSYLKKQYSISRDVRTVIANVKQAKDTNRMPVKVHGITGDRIWHKTNTLIELLDTDAGMLECCSNFVNLINAEEEVTADDELGYEAGDGGPMAINPANHARGGTPGSRKRKGSASAGTTPVKRIKNKPRRDLGRSTSISSTDELGDDDGDYEG